MSRKLDFKSLRNLSLITHIGLVMVLPIIGSVVLGNWLDEKLGTNIIFTIVCIVLGVITSFLNLYKISIKKIEESKSQDERDTKSKNPDS